MNDLLQAHGLALVSAVLSIVFIASTLIAPQTRDRANKHAPHIPRIARAATNISEVYRFQRDNVEYE